MSVKALFTALFLLLLSGSCLMGAEEGLDFPNYLQASRTLPGEITVPPVFSVDGNYGIAASGDTLYHMELRHGRVHGKTTAGETIEGLVTGPDGTLFVLTRERLLRVEGFSVSAETVLPGSGAVLTMSGTHPVILMENGSILVYSGADLSIVQESSPPLKDMEYLQGFPGMVCVSSDGGRVTTLSIPDMTVLVENSFESPLLFMTASGSNLLLSTENWNEIAVCSPQDLRITVMYTFPEAPVHAAGDPSLSYVYGVCPAVGVQVCLESGEIAWRSTDYGAESLVSLSGDGEAAMISCGNRLDILIR